MSRAQEHLVHLGLALSVSHKILEMRLKYHRLRWAVYPSRYHPVALIDGGLEGMPHSVGRKIVKKTSCFLLGSPRCNPLASVVQIQVNIPKYPDPTYADSVLYMIPPQLRVSPTCPK